MKLAAVLAASALVASPLMAVQQESAATPAPVQTFAGTAAITGIQVWEVVNTKAGLKLYIEPEGPISVTATNTTEGDVTASGTAVITSGTHTFSYSWSRYPTGNPSIVVPVNDLTKGDPIDVSVTAQTQDSPDVARLTINDFDFVKTGVARVMNEPTAYQTRCYGRAMTGGVDQNFSVRSYGDKYLDLSATATFYSKGKKMLTKPVSLRHGKFQIVTDGGEFVQRGNYPKIETNYIYSWNGKINRRRVTGTYRWVLNVTDKATNKTFSVSHVPVHLLPKGATCAAYRRNV
jgi:hypothetical protein